MTNKRDLKALVRERMEKTGETYMQAKAAVQKVALGSSAPGCSHEKASMSDDGARWECPDCHLVRRYMPVERGELAKGAAPRIECIFCQKLFDGLEGLKIHSANCSEHPAVIEALRIRQLDQLTAAELRERMTALGAAIPASEREQLVAVRGVAGEVPPKIAEWLELSRLAGRAAAREERAAKLSSKLKPTEAMKRALSAWGVTIDVDGKMFGPDGTPLKAKWSHEPVNEMKVFSADAEVQMASMVMTDVFTSLMGKDGSKDLDALRVEMARANHGRNYWVWETEYPEEGSVEIGAFSAEEAKEFYRRETGSPADLDLTAVPVGPEHDDKAPAVRRLKSTYRTWAEVKAERFKDRPEALADIEKRVEEDIATLIGSQHHFRIGDVDFPIGSLSLKGRTAFMNEQFYTKLPCGHLVLNAASEQAVEAAKEMSQKFGIDAAAELKAMIDGELERHQGNKCLEPASKDETPDWQEISKRSPTPEEQKAYTDPFTGGTDSGIARRLRAPLQQAKKAGFTDEELKERALLADPVELKKFLDGPPVPARAKYLSVEDEQKVALTVSQYASPQNPFPTNIEYNFPSTGPIEEVGHFDPDTFTLVKMEQLPCGHGLRKNTEIPTDLKAMYGDAGVEAWNRLLEQERQKHLNYKCEEACTDFKLVPRFAPSKNMVVLVLMNNKGEYLYPPDAASYEPPPSLVSVFVNGASKDLQGPYANREELLWAAGLASGRTATITYQSASGDTGGTLARDTRLELAPGMIFKVTETQRVEVIIELNGKKTLTAAAETYESLVRLAGFPEGYPTTFPTVTYRHGQFQGTLPPRKELRLLNGMVVTVEATIERT